MKHKDRIDTSRMLARAILGVCLAVAKAAGQDVVINVPPNAAPREIGAGTQLNLNDGGELRSFFEANAGSRVEIRGGRTGGFFEANPGSLVHISGGIVGSDYKAMNGSITNITGGEVGAHFDALGGTVNISGGVVGRRFQAEGGVITISGGIIGEHFEAKDGSRVNLTGGSVGGYFSTQAGSTVEVTGGTFGRGFNFSAAYNAKIGGVSKFYGDEFLLNGVPIAESSVALSEADIMTGTLADGSTFLFAPQVQDDLRFVEFVQAPIPTLDTTPRIADDAQMTAGLRPGQTLTLVNGGAMPRDAAIVGATLNVSGGMVGEGMEATNSTVHIDGGSIGKKFFAFAGSAVEMEGGRLGNSFRAVLAAGRPRLWTNLGRKQGERALAAHRRRPSRDLQGRN